jgi:hypothetical protein
MKSFETIKAELMAKYVMNYASDNSLYTDIFDGIGDDRLFSKNYILANEAKSSATDALDEMYELGWLEASEEDASEVEHLKQLKQNWHEQAKIHADKFERLKPFLKEELVTLYPTAQAGSLEYDYCRNLLYLIERKIEV